MNSNNEKTEDERKTKEMIANLIIEVLGRPKEHLIAALEDILKKINEEKGIEIRNKKVHEPVLLKDQKDTYTSFAEIEVGVEEIGRASCRERV